MKPAIIVLLSCLAAAAPNVFIGDKADPAAAGMDAARLARIPARMKEFVDAGKAAGIVTLVARHGHIASLDAVGYQELESKVPMRADTLFRIASLTKPITCAGVMILVDEGRVSLSDPLEKYVPEYKGQKLNPCGTRGGINCGLIAPVRPINLLDLMTHTSGLPGSSPRTNDVAPGSLAEMVADGAKSSLLFEPGSAWNYSNIGIAALGRVVEVVAKEPFDRFMAEKIFEPARMTDTFFFVPPGKKNRVAAVYTYEGTALKRAPLPDPEPGRTIPAPQGGLFSTALDLARFHQMLLNKGTLDGRRILSSAAVELMTTSQTGHMKAGFSPGVGHGLGFEVVREPLGMFRYNSIGTFVKGGAYRTCAWVDPAKDMIGVILLQRTNGGGDVADEINSFMTLAAAAIER